MGKETSTPDAQIVPNRYFAKSVVKNQSSQIPIFNIELNYPEI